MTRRPRGAPFEASLELLGDCLVWTAGHTNGYGSYHHPEKKRTVHAHTYAWERVFGPVPAGYELHHLCHVKPCVSPSHLKLLSKAEHRRLHNAEITHCPAGHEYSKTNTRIIGPKRGRGCRQCHRDRERERKRRERGYPTRRACTPAR